MRVRELETELRDYALNSNRLAARARVVFLVLLLFVLLAGCRGVFEVGIEQTPTPHFAATETLSALKTENARLATRVAEQAASLLPVNLGRLAYVQGGDIWVKTLPDGKPQRLTTDGRNRDPRWSPSGDWIAFRKDSQVVVRQEVPCEIPSPRAQTCFETVSSLQRQAWLIRADGSSAHPLNQGLSVETFAWSPVNDRLAFVTPGGALHLSNADGSGLLKMIPSGDSARDAGQVAHIAWSPDGNWIAYEWKVQPPDPASTYQGLWKISKDGKERLELYDANVLRRGEAILARWTPLGKTVLFWQGESRSSHSLDGLYLYGVETDRQSSGSAPAVRYSADVMLTYPDFVAPAPPRSQLGARDTVALVVGAGRGSWNNKRIELPHAVSPKTIAAIAPAWSPDGARLAYVGMPEQEDPGFGESAVQALLQRRIWIVDVSGESTPRRLTNTAGYREERPLWSADGSHILFARMDSRGRASLWIAPANGVTVYPLVDELTPVPDPFGSYGHVDWDTLFDWWSGAE
jgi:Tol biopolymer transport system component